MAGFDNDVLYNSAGADFRAEGVSPVSNQYTTNGDLIMAAATGQKLRVGVLEAFDSSVTLAYTEPSATTNKITIKANASGMPTVPTTFSADTGSATPAANNLNVLGTSGVAGTAPVATSGSGSTLTMSVQKAQALAGTDATKVGLANFDSSAFAVDANGFVTLTAGAAIETITGDTGGALNPTAGNFNIVSTTTNGIDTSGSGSTLTIGMASPYSDASFAFTRAASGATNTLTIANTSDTASSHALNQVTSGGTSGGDAQTTYTVTGAQSFSQGIDNSASDFFTTSASTALGTSNVHTIDPATGNNRFWGIGTAVRFNSEFQHTNTDAASDVRVAASVIDSSAADPYFQVVLPATMAYCWGIDNSDNDSLKICADANSDSAVPSGGTLLWKMTQDGEVTMPQQPSFLAYNSAANTNATGAGTVATVEFDTEIYDQGSNFNTTTDTFTSPVTGRYLFNINVGVLNLSSAMTASTLKLVTSNRTYFLHLNNPYAVRNVNSGGSILKGSINTDMDSSDTAYVTITIANGAGDTATIYGGAEYQTFFSGQLLA